MSDPLNPQAHEMADESMVRNLAAQALAIWQQASGIEIDPRALGWWEIFASVKGLAIWISSGREYADGRNRDLILVLASWFPTDVHDRVLVERLAPTGGVDDEA